MADLALGAVFVSSNTTEFQLEALQAVDGFTQKNMRSVSAVLESYGAIGFQASHFAQAVEICKKMLHPQPPSLQPKQPLEGEDGTTSKVMVQPAIFLGVTANLFGTGCREAIRFLCAERVPLPDGVVPAVLPDENESPVGNEGAISRFSFSPKALIHALVVSGGAMEHDIRRACEAYRLLNNVSEKEGIASAQNHHQHPQEEKEGTAMVMGTGVRFGNIMYGGGDDVSKPRLFTAVMRHLVKRLLTLQQQRKAVCVVNQTLMACNDVCSWSFSPSTVWFLAGRWLPELFATALVEMYGKETEAIRKEAQRRAESTVLYWAAKNDVPIFSPSFVDGDIMQFVFEAGELGTPLLKLDLVMDIHRINRYAMRSQRSGMIILGGGVVKHHVCNANLMRNGADYTVFINNGQEFDGSDAGARPDEAISWGKIRLDGEYVKVYAEVTLVFPLLVAQVFLPWVRAARGLGNTVREREDDGV